MAVLMVPPADDRPWPTLGPEVCAWMEASLAFGPGDLRGEPYVLDDEDRAFIYRMYEVYPPPHPKAGRRRFTSAVLMLRKGTKKSERAGAIAAAELDGPVRCDGFRQADGVWVPVGRPVRDPYIPIVAYSEKQAEDTAFAVLYVMLSEGPAADHFDIGLDRIMRARGDGKAEALATSPNSRDGARTTFQVKEETHRWTLPRQHDAHATMTANLAKRPRSDPWELHVTTPYKPGAGSVAEKVHNGARRVHEAGDDVARRSRLFFFYRWADESIDASTREGLLEAIDAASGPTIGAWSDNDRIADQWDADDADRPYLNRTWLARIEKSADQAFDPVAWEAVEDPSHVVPDGAAIVLAWHGSRYWDAAALVAVELATGYVWPIEIWQRPDDALEWEVPEDEVDAVMADTMQRWRRVWKVYVNPDRWESTAATWAARYGADRVLSWKTNRWTLMASATRAFGEAIRSGELSQSGDVRLAAHVGAAHRRTLTHIKDEDGRPVWVPTKERADSPFPINAAQAAIIVWQARLDAIKAGALAPVQWRVA